VRPRWLRRILRVHHEHTVAVACRDGVLGIDWAVSLRSATSFDLERGASSPRVHVNEAVVRSQGANVDRRTTGSVFAEGRTSMTRGEKVFATGSTPIGVPSSQ
jgi:hypothetical protein